MPRGSGVVLVGLDGRIVARLPRFASYPSSNTTRDGLMHNLDWAGILEQPRLVGPGDRYYRIDASHHALIPVPGQRVPLPGGAELVGHGSATEFRGLSVVRDGRVLVRRDMNLVVAAGTVVQSRGRLLDLRTGSPALHIQRTTYDQQGRPFEYLESFFRGDKYVYYAELRSEGAATGYGTSP